MFQMIIRKHKILILIGCLLWILGFFMAAASIYPYALIGVYFAPPILILGIIGWTINYKHTKNHYPNLKRSFKRILDKRKGLLKYHFAMIEFLYKYVLHFWVLCVVYWMGLTFIFTTVIENSNAFAATKKYVENDTELIRRIGQIEYYGFLIDGSFSSSGDAEI